ncbi:class I adenylate-forming enzyme family protein [Nocardioides terrigena]|uniref:class I adenylate-forming enzyme family protein n=1 Tax=Nocardioides terrigena TaxID=424797 RepID=UPI000D2F5765|nr:AMP-binding protein [Nocardioides terrigena]
MPDTLREVVLLGRRFGDRVAVRAGSGERSHSDLVDRASRLARHLARSGLVPGDRVVAMVEDGLRSLEPHLAAALAGLVVVPVNARFRTEELDHILRDCGARALAHSSGVGATVARSEVVGELDLVLDTGPGDGAATNPAYEALVTQGSSDAPDVLVEPDDVAMIGYTSGTTGHPKGAVMTHRAGLEALRANLVAFRVVPYGACAFSGSVSFTALLWGFVYPHLHLGCSIDMLQPDLTVERWFDRMEEHGSTFTFVPTPYLDDFAAEASRRPAATARLAGVCHSASPATAGQREAMVAALGPVYLESYGMTETLAAVTVTTSLDPGPGSQAESPHLTIGRPLPPADVYPVDAAGRRVGPGEVGELVVESPSLFAGYWERPEATAAALREGRLHTGDLGHVDPHGFVYVDGREADLIISGGMNVYPAEVERVLHTHPDIVESAVVGVPHPRWGESVCAVVVPREGSALTADEVVDHVRSRLAGYKKPTRVELVHALPRNANLKVLKGVLRSRLS